MVTTATTIESHIQGIPCQIEVTHFHKKKASYSHNAPSDLDYLGYTEIEFQVRDRKGYEAPWLTRKMTPEDINRIEQAIIDYYHD